MVCEIMLYTSNDLKDFVRPVRAFPLDTGVHTIDNQTVDGKSILGLMAIDCKKPIEVISEGRGFLKQLDRRAADKDL